VICPRGRSGRRTEGREGGGGGLNRNKSIVKYGKGQRGDRRGERRAGMKFNHQKEPTRGRVLSLQIGVGRIGLWSAERALQSKQTPKHARSMR